jgi:hypothetical protein
MGNTIWLVIAGVIILSFLISFILANLFGKIWSLIPSGILLILTIIFSILIAVPEGSGSWVDLSYIIFALVTGIAFVINTALTFAFLIVEKK